MTSPRARLKRAAFSALACWSPRTRDVSPLVHKDLKLECGYVVVELKAVDSLAPVHEAIVLTYLRPSGHRPGLLINFNVNVLKDGIRRYII